MGRHLPGSGIFRGSGLPQDLSPSGPDGQRPGLLGEVSLENSLAAFFFREDFHDFYRRYGAGVFAYQNITRNLRLSAEYRSDTYENMERTASWSMLGARTGKRRLGVIESNWTKSRRP